MADLPDWTTGVDILAQTIGNLTVDIAAQTISELSVDITAQTVGNIAVNLAASAVTLNINVSSSVDLNIKTSGGTNIVIDKLVQGAYTPRDNWLAANDNGVTDGTDPPSSLNNDANWWGKYFPRGVKGQMGRFNVYCKGNGTDTITLGYSPYPGGPEIGTATITPEVTWKWKHFLPVFFNTYDSMNIYIKGVGANVYVAYDSGVRPYDVIYSTDSGKTWDWWNRRLYVRADMFLTTEGDLPVTGTVTAVLLPNESVKHGGLWSAADWSAKAGVDKNISGFVSAAAPHGAYVITYTVPAGKVLYVNQFSAIAYSANAGDNLRATLEVPGATTVCSIGGVNGCAFPLVKPMKATAGQAVRLYAHCYGAVNPTIVYGTINGYEVDS